MDNILSIDPQKAASEGAWLELLHPVTGEVLKRNDKPIRICLKGADSDEYRRSVALQQAKLSKRRGIDLAKASADEVMDILSKGEENSVSSLVAVTVAFDNLSVSDDGADFPFTPENATFLYSKRPWVREQVMEFVFSRANFLKTT